MHYPLNKYNFSRWLSGFSNKIKDKKYQQNKSRVLKSKPKILISKVSSPQWNKLRLTSIDASNISSLNQTKNNKSISEHFETTSSNDMEKLREIESNPNKLMCMLLKRPKIMQFEPENNLNLKLKERRHKQITEKYVDSKKLDKNNCIKNIKIRARRYLSPQEKLKSAYSPVEINQKEMPKALSSKFCSPLRQNLFPPRRGKPSSKTITTNSTSCAMVNSCKSICLST